MFSARVSTQIVLSCLRYQSSFHSVRFDTLSLDCNDHLFVYDGGHAAGPPKIDISCRNTKQSVGVIITNTNHVTLKYVTDGWGTDSNGFKLVVRRVSGVEKFIKSI